MTERAYSSSGNRSCALVTGASRGIGRAIAQDAGRFHDEVILVARSGEALHDVHSSLKDFCSAAHVVPADITLPDQAERIAQFVESKFGRLDTLVHAAGIYANGPASDEYSNELMNVNYHAPVRLTSRLLPLLKIAKGQIVFINSTQGLRAGGDVGAYAASKFALRAFADSLREEVNAHGVRVMSVFAGATATEMQERIHERAGRPYRPERLLQPSDIAEMVVAALRLPRSAELVDMTIRPMQPANILHS